VMFFESAGSYAPHTPSPLRGSVLRFGGGLRLAADSAERSATRVCACAPKSWRAWGKLSPAHFGVTRGSMNATWYNTNSRSKCIQNDGFRPAWRDSTHPPNLAFYRS